MARLFCLLLVALVSAVLPTLSLPKSSDQCLQNVNCHLPDCLCPATYHPGNLTMKDVPQFVILSFDDAVYYVNEHFYASLKDIMNPNNCRITMTFFLTHLYTDYTLVNELYRLGHEISLHSVTHKPDVWGYWKEANTSVWKHEMVDLHKIVVKNANIPPHAIKGWRAPFLEMGGEEMFTAQQEAGLTYDASWPTQTFTNWLGGDNNALWPYTLDFPTIQECPIGRCPSEKYPGHWVVPMLDLQDNAGYSCSMLDACRSETDELLTSSEAVENFLKRNFLMNYENNKAPFGLHAHYSWFLASQEVRELGYTKFLQWLSTLDDVYVVSLDRLLAWMRNPVPLSEIKNVQEFICPAKDPETTCPIHHNYRFTAEHNIPPNMYEVYMDSCTIQQPPYYPWIYNPYGMEDKPILN